MSAVTLEAIDKLLESKFEEKLEPVNTKLDALIEIVSGHTVTLDAIVKQTKDWNAEMAVMRQRMERYEKVLKQMARKLNFDIEPLLH